MKVLACLPRGRKVPVKAAKISGATSKLTGPRYYSRESLRDVFVHGTHFASAVKGNAVEDVNLYGLGNEKGVPAAKIATYKECELFCCGHIRPSQLEHVTSQMSQEVAQKYTMPTNSRGLNCSSFSGLPLVLHAQTCFICDVNINVFRNSSQVAFSSFAWIDNQEFQTSYFRGTRGLLGGVCCTGLSRTGLSSETKLDWLRLD